MTAATAAKPKPGTGPIELAARFRREIRQVMVWEAVLTGSMMLVVPFLVNLVLYLGLRLTHPDDLVLWGGGAPVLLPQLLAGIFFGVWLVPRVIRLRFPPPRAEALLALYLESEEAKYGRLGRFLVLWAGALSLVLLVLPLVLAGNRYTLIDARRVEYGAAGLLPPIRVTLPHGEVERVLELRRRTKSGSLTGGAYYALYRGGLILSSRSSFAHQGALSSLPTKDEALAADAIARAAGKEIERRVLEPEEPCPPEVGECP